MIEFMTLLIVPAALVVLYDVLNVSFRLKILLKMDLEKEIKPLDCLFCMSFWFYASISLIVLLLNSEMMLLYMASGVVISYLLEKTKK